MQVCESVSDVYNTCAACFDERSFSYCAENLRDVDIPSHVEETLKQTHEEVMKDIVEETRRLQTTTVDDDASVDTESDPVVKTDSAVKTEAAVGADAAGDVASQTS